MQRVMLAWRNAAQGGAGRRRAPLALAGAVDGKRQESPCNIVP